MRGADLTVAEPGGVTFEQAMASEVRTDVLDFAAAVLDREWLAYDPSYSLSAGQAFADDLAEVPELARIHAALIGGRAPADQPGDPIVAMAHEVFADPARSIVAYRIKGPGIATRRPRGLRTLLLQDNVLEPINGEIVFYESRFDALVLGDAVVVTATTTLTRALGSTDRIQKLARDTFAKATRKVSIEGADALAQAAATDPAMASKMAQLSRILDDDPEYAKLLTTKNLLQFLDRNPQVHIATTGEGDRRRLLFESAPAPATRSWKLLADDYLRSDLSKRSYECGRQAPRSRTEPHAAHRAVRTTPSRTVCRSTRE